MVECNWQSSYTLTIPNDWTTGVYLAKLAGSIPANGNDPEQNYEIYVIFVVRDDNSKSDLLFQCCVNTHQACNYWGGKDRSICIYGDYNQTGDAIFEDRGYAVSFNRPYITGYGTGEFFRWEFPLLRWLERNGYDVAYITNIDTHSSPNLILQHRVYLSGGKDEYWSRDMRNNVQSALENGKSLAFIGADSMYWQVRMDPTIRKMICYKRDCHDPSDTDTTYTTDCTGFQYYSDQTIHDPVYSSDPGHDNSLVTVLWRGPVLNEPEEGWRSEEGWGKEFPNGNRLTIAQPSTSNYLFSTVKVHLFLISNPHQRYWSTKMMATLKAPNPRSSQYQEEHFLTAPITTCTFFLPL